MLLTAHRSSAEIAETLDNYYVSSALLSAPLAAAALFLFKLGAVGFLFFNATVFGGAMTLKRLSRVRDDWTDIHLILVAPVLTWGLLFMLLAGLFGPLGNRMALVMVLIVPAVFWTIVDIVFVVRARAALIRIRKVG
jgi:hypothetical protein